MRLLYTDECNISPDEAEFFIYVGVGIQDDVAGAFSKEIEEIRGRNSYKPGDLLKFNTHQGPAHIKVDQHRAAKSELLDAAAKYGVVMFASFILHNVAKSPDDARLNEINRICFHFHCHLNRENDHGLVLLDTFTDKELIPHLRKKFSIGLKGMPYSETMRLPRILGYHLASIGTSHLCSVVDIVAGSLRFAVNALNERGRKREVAATLLQKLAPLCIRTGSGKADELSIFFSPKVIRVKKYLAEYAVLHAFLAQNGIDAAQLPTGERLY